MACSWQDRQDGRRTHDAGIKQRGGWLGWGEDVCASYYVRGLGVEEGEEGTQRQEADQPHNAMDDVSHFLHHICCHISYCLLRPVNVSTHFAIVCF